MEKQLTLKGYAKINLTLDVTDRRDDGYHLVESILQSISLADTITIELREEPGIELTCTDPLLPVGEGNTAFRAARLFLNHHAKDAGLRIAIDKQIPHQAGLGGASADAAAVLVGLNHLFHTQLSEDALRELGVQIGADVPFCIGGGTQLAKGIGEQLQPLPPMPDCALVVCKPPLNVSTQLAYEQIDHAPPQARPDTKAMLQALEQNDVAAVACLLSNVFEAALELPGIDVLLRHMEQDGALGARMSGSGSAVFGIFREPERAAACREHLLATYPDTFLCQPVRQGVFTA